MLSETLPPPIPNVRSRCSAKISVFERAATEILERPVLPHLGAAYNLAWWLMLNERRAAEVVCEAYADAFWGFGRDLGEQDARVLLLKIVHDICYVRLKESDARRRSSELRTVRVDVDSAPANRQGKLPQENQCTVLQQALQALPIVCREVIILRELENLSESEISAVTGMPVGPVVFQLARARRRLIRCLESRPGAGCQPA